MKKAIVSTLLVAGLTVGISSIGDAAPSTKARRHGVDCAAQSRKGGQAVSKGVRTPFSQCVTTAAKA